MVAEVQEEKTSTALDQIKVEIVAFLSKSIEFTQKPYQDLQFSSLTPDRILVDEYQDYDDNLCLAINIAIPDEVYPSYEKEDILNFMRDKADPVVRSLFKLKSIKDLVLNYRMVNIFLRGKTEFSNLEQ